MMKPRVNEAYGCLPIIVGALVTIGIIATCYVALALSAVAADVTARSYQGTVVHVTDGDTIQVHISG